MDGEGGMVVEEMQPAFCVVLTVSLFMLPPCRYDLSPPSRYVCRRPHQVGWPSEEQPTSQRACKLQRKRETGAGVATSCPFLRRAACRSVCGSNVQTPLRTSAATALGGGRGRYCRNNTPFAHGPCFVTPPSR